MTQGRVGALSLFALGVNGVVGVGIFFTPNLIAELVPGEVGALVFLATGVLLLPVALTFAGLGARIGLDGGPYVWARAAFGDEVAFGVGWVAAVSALLSTAAVLAGLRDHLAPALHVPDGVGRVAFVWGCVFVLSSIAALGLRPSAFTWDVLTLLKLVPLAALLILAFFSAPGLDAAPSSRAPSAFARALLIAVFPLQGFEVVPVLAGSARGRGAVVLATAGSLLFGSVLYAMIQLACVSASPALATESAPLVAAAKRLGGAPLMSLVSIGTNLSAVATAFGMIVMTPRYVAALGTGGGPAASLARLDERSVPRAALFGTAVVVALLASSERLGVLFVLSSAAVLLQYVSAVASLVRLALGRRADLSAAWLVPALVSLGSIAFLAQAVELRELVGLGLTLLAGAGVAVLSARAKRRAIR